MLEKQASKKAKRDTLVPLPRFYLIEHRNKLNLSMEEASRLLNVSIFYYYQIENGKRGSKLPLKLIVNLIKVLKIDAFKFLEYEEEHAIKSAEINKGT
ncbi:MAG: helix-turn-helix transcriptional regulator [Acholeplasmataceae bacterium]|nr:helix-turn-helix transcriptional regulator [Acholeplasmataceae bacterium]